MGFRQHVVKTVVGGLDHSGFRRLVERIHHRRLTILCYHSIVDGPIPAPLRQGGLHLDRTMFAAQVEYLAKSFDVLPLDRALAELGGRETGRSRPGVAITFDDGYANNLELAAPLLARAGLPATIFLVPGLVSSDRPFWWDELPLLVEPLVNRRIALAGHGTFDLARPDERATMIRTIREHCMRAGLEERRTILDGLAKETDGLESELGRRLRPLRRDEVGCFPTGITFGNHSATHRILDLVDEPTLRWEVETGRTQLEELVPAELRSDVFCYPRGAMPSGAAAIIPTLGIRWAVALAGRRTLDGCASVHSPMTAIPRIIVGAEHSLARFRLSVAGVVLG